MSSLPLLGLPWQQQSSVDPAPAAVWMCHAGSGEVTVPSDAERDSLRNEGPERPALKDEEAFTQWVLYFETRVTFKASENPLVIGKAVPGALGR